MTEFSYPIGKLWERAQFERDKAYGRLTSETQASDQLVDAAALARAEACEEAIKVLQAA